ncbi:uncharacterized protein LOC118276788 [Spodoptera frugiperda]|uniref:Uncharacterized protein LOC118276788 n=1 Tax=Spodoptera frugiperda TaxID=7108 RepID=A0A9R0DFJ0_SPOFR|nr:uncharacterized protein LOC118276788 [Spodoptera frugiperda]
MKLFHTNLIVSLFYTAFAAPQQPEINDQFKITDLITEQPVVSLDHQTSQNTNQTVFVETEKPVEETTTKVVPHQANAIEISTQPALPEISFSVRIYRLISEPIIKVVNTPKVSAVLRNIGTCVVNGAMELFNYYLPAPFMPLIASAAGLVIPFEPVVMLKEKMPVTSYRRAFQTAMSSFLRTFDKYKMEEDYDPYMTRRFNRRFGGDDLVKKDRNQ